MKEKDLYKVDMLAFDSKIGYITNLGTTFYEMQSQYKVGSPEYEEINRRLKLCCIEQNRTIDAAKGLETKPFPKHWTSYQKINEEDSAEEKARKEFENKLVIDKRPEFMRYLYSHYEKQYKNFNDDFNLYSSIVLGKKINQLDGQCLNDSRCTEMLEYYHKKNPLLETNGVMNKLCRYMQSELSDVKKSTKADNDLIYEKLINLNIDIDEFRLDLLLEKFNEYNEFKKTKQLKTSTFSTYEQYYKYLRNDCLEKISSNIQELANLAVHICYKTYPSKPKDFCWNVFGGGIVENLKEKHLMVKVPKQDEFGILEYLGNYYTMADVYTASSLEFVSFEDFDEDLFADLEDDDVDF